MITKDLLAYLSTKLGIERRDLLEKDILLHQILALLAQEDYFSKNYIFKGGTCLIKCYLGYYRFSEDLDFSWKKQDLFAHKTEKQIRRELSEEIEHVAHLLERIAQRLGLLFKADKKDVQFIEFGGSNKFVTFKLWYDSLELGKKQFVKLQINFVELFLNKAKNVSARNILGIRGINQKEFLFLFPHSGNLVRPIKLQAYDLKEIAIEKARAVLTRKEIKARDFLDLYLLEERYGIRIEKFKGKIMEKTQFMLRYEKYLNNLKENKSLTAIPGDEAGLLLQPLDQEKYSLFLKRAKSIFQEIRDRLIKN